MDFTNTNQLKAFMKKEAKRLNITPNVAYTTYFSRLLLERLSLINQGNVVVKGSFSQYVHLKELSRPVLDIDLSSKHSIRVSEEMLYRSMYETGDGIVSYDLTSIPHKSKNGVYKLPVAAKIKYPDEKEIIVPLPVDFKENNPVIFETQFKAVEPLFMGDEKFYVNTPSFEEHIAEKLYIISHNVRCDIVNTRVKDFYDIYMLHGKDYDADKFSLYFQAMVIIYGGNLNELDAEFINKKFIRRHESIWESMQEKYQFTNREIDFDEAAYYAKAVLKEQIQKIRHHQFTDQAINLVRRKY